MGTGDRGSSAQTVSAVVARVGPTEPLRLLLSNLAQQTHPVSEVIVVDQTTAPLPDDVRGGDWPFGLRYIHCPGRHDRGRARNTGWRQANGNWLLFAEEQCRYPKGYLARALALARNHGADILTGRSADPAGAILGRFGSAPRWISHRTVLTSQAKWNMLVCRNVMKQLGGYDEAVSPGGEGYDLLFRAVALDLACRFEPSLLAHRVERQIGAHYRDEALRRGRDHARGLGQALAAHGFGLPSAAYWIARSIANLGVSMAALRSERARYYLHQAAGRLEGFAGCSLPIPRYPQKDSVQGHASHPAGVAAPQVRPVDDR